MKPFEYFCCIEYCYCFVENSLIRRYQNLGYIIKDLKQLSHNLGNYLWCFFTLFDISYGKRLHHIVESESSHGEYVPVFILVVRLYIFFEFEIQECKITNISNLLKTCIHLIVYSHKDLRLFIIHLDIGVRFEVLVLCSIFKPTLGIAFLNKIEHLRKIFVLFLIKIKTMPD